ncbi:MAG TPA: glycosyltransferase family 4 protein [Chthoniobacterales bacterium]|nr:glycosyltransferase family 4 protein [Chthoniobacterales bacterium]
MKIAQLAPLTERVPPVMYGGTEQVVGYLTEALIDLGHELTLFASGDSVTRAQLVPGSKSSLRLRGKTVKDPVARHVAMLGKLLKNRKQYDLIHFHIDYLHLPILRQLAVPTLTTMHGRLDLPELQAVLQQFPSAPLVSISNAQREPLGWANWMGTVYHGLPEDELIFRSNSEDYLAFLGRICPEKGLDRAIEIARKAGIPLKVAAKVDSADRDYFQSVIKPLLRQPYLDFIGEIGQEEKSAFLGGARALLFPIDWPEPFGLVMIEALACGTPVIAFDHGSVREIIEDGRSGYIVNDLPSAIEAVQKIDRLDRAACRQSFLERFTSRRMAENYTTLYEKLTTR